MKKNMSVSATATVLMILLLRWQGSSLQTIISPHGIVDLEFAATPLRLQQLLQVWKRSAVTANIWLDFLFIVSYVLFLSMSSEFCAMKWPAGVMREVGHTLTRVSFIAGLLDIAENLLMLQSLSGNFTTTSLQLTSYCAAVKFTLAAVIIFYLVVSLPVVLKKNKL